MFPWYFTHKCSSFQFTWHDSGQRLSRSLTEAQDGLFAAVVSKLSLLQLAGLQSLVFLRECWWLNSWSLVSSCQGPGKVRPRYEANRSVMHDWFHRFNPSCSQSKVHNHELLVYLVICGHLCWDRFDAGNPVIYIYTFFHIFLWLDVSGCLKIHLEKIQLHSFKYLSS